MSRPCSLRRTNKPVLLLIAAAFLANACAWRLPWQEKQVSRAVRPTAPPVVNVLAAAEALIPEIEPFKAVVEANRGVTLDPPYADALAAAADGVSAGLRERSAALRQRAGAPSSGGPVGQGVSALEEAARQLDTLVQRSRSILKQQNRPMFAAAAVLLSGLQTLAQEMRREASPLPAADLWLDGFQFDGQLPGVVPQQGGRLVLTGGGWWDGSVPPELWLYDREGLYVRKLALQKEGVQGSLSTVLDADTLRGNAGGCLELRLRAFRPATVQGQAGRWLERRVAACVPPAYDVTLEVAAGVHCTRTLIEQTELPDRDLKRFAWRNDDCPSDGARGVSATHSWPLRLDKGKSDCRIVGFQTLKEERQGLESDIRLEVSGVDAIVASGTLGAADCSAKRLVPAIWAATVRPTLECRVTEHARYRAVAPEMVFRAPATTICVEIPTRGDAFATDHYWFMVTPAINGMRLDPIAISPGTPEEELMLAGSVKPVAGIGSSASIEASRLNGQARVCVIVREE